MDTYNVIGEYAVGGVAPGGTVELDPDAVNIPALIEGGHVEPAKPAKSAKRGRDGEA